MAGLTDIAPVAKQVLIPDGDKEVAVDVAGLAIADIRDIIVRYPDTVAMLNKGINIKTLLMAGPEVIAAILAAALGTPTEAGEKFVAKLGAGLQVEILNIVIKLTMPHGPGPFLELLKMAGIDVVEKIPSVAVSPEQSNI